MKIIIGEDNVRDIQQKYIVLELDQFVVQQQPEPVSAYCLIDQAPLQDLLEMQQWKDLHDNLIKNYRLKNWNYCAQALEHLQGRWGGELDSFYTELAARVDSFSQQDPGVAWTHVLER
jgi:hypothetical protein